MMIIALFGILTISAAASASDDWLSFKQIHGKKYRNALEEFHRQNIFLENNKLIEEHNRNYEKGIVSFRMKMNHFGDLTQEEFRAQISNFKTSDITNRGSSAYVAPENGKLPESIDWRQKGGVTPVKNQQDCGACWAFSTTGAVEGHYFHKTGKLVELSEQNLIDCVTANDGCGGGGMLEAFKYIKENGGIDTEESYPYEAMPENCRFKNSSIGAIITDFVRVPERSEAVLKLIVGTLGPVSVGVKTTLNSFQFYSGGVYDDEECYSVCDDLNHAMLVVGYGNENGKDYWLVKNSFSSAWGDQGYIKIARNFNNQCGIACLASYPEV